MIAASQSLSRPVVTLPDHLAPKVLTPTFMERLAALNAAMREIRALGLTVVWSRLAGERPAIQVLRDADITMVPLLNRMENRQFLPRDGNTLVVGDFMGCQVSWLESK